MLNLLILGVKSCKTKFKESFCKPAQHIFLNSYQILRSIGKIHKHKEFRENSFLCVSEKVEIMSGNLRRWKGKRDLFALEKLFVIQDCGNNLCTSISCSTRAFAFRWKLFIILRIYKMQMKCGKLFHIIIINR